MIADQNQDSIMESSLESIGSKLAATKLMKHICHYVYIFSP